MSLDYGSAAEEDYEGTRPDDWAWTDKLAAALAYQLRKWRVPYPNAAGPNDGRNAAERAHNLRLVAATATAWADELEKLAADERDLAEVTRQWVADNLRPTRRLWW